MQGTHLFAVGAQRFDDSVDAAEALQGLGPVVFHLPIKQGILLLGRWSTQIVRSPLVQLRRLAMSRRTHSSYIHVLVHMQLGHLDLLGLRSHLRGGSRRFGRCRRRSRIGGYSSALHGNRIVGRILVHHGCSSSILKLNLKDRLSRWTAGTSAGICDSYPLFLYPHFHTGTCSGRTKPSWLLANRLLW